MNKSEWIALLKKLKAMPLSSRLILGAVIVGFMSINWVPTLLFHQPVPEQSSNQNKQ